MAAKASIVLLFMLSLVTGGSAISCHQCQYTELEDGVIHGEGCKTPDNVDYSVLCEDTETVNFCAKVTPSNYERIDGLEVKELVLRTCAFDDLCTEVGSSEFEDDGVKYKVHCCEGDNCNSGAALLPALTMLLVSLLAARITM